MKITKNDIEHVAHLARLSLSESELDMMTGQLDNILSYVDKLNEINTDGVKATSHVFSITNAFREDEERPSLPQHEALENGPQHSDETFQVPRIIG